MDRPLSVPMCAPARPTSPLATELTFTIPGEPVAKERARFRVVGRKGDGKAFAQGYTPDKTVSYEKHVATIAKLACNLARWMTHEKDRFAVVVKIFRTHEGVGGDLDNYVKALFDGLNGVVWPDDRYVRSLGVSLRGPSKKPRIEVVIRRFRQGERAASPRKGSTKS